MKKQSIKERIKALNAKQKRKFKTALIMSLVCVVLLSGATFAWFTISNTAKVNNLELTVVAEGSLYIADDEVGLLNKHSDLNLSFAGINQKLYPCTTDDVITMKKPVYSSNNEVSGVALIDMSAESTEKKLYYYEKEFWLLIEEQVSPANSYAITLAKNDINDTGTYIKGKANDAVSNPEYCIRVSFIVGEGVSQQVAVYEPNSDTHLPSTPGTNCAISSVTGYENTHKQLNTGDNIGKFSEIGSYYAGDSSELFVIEGNQPTKVTMRVWFEGTDKDCVNDIQNLAIKGALKFVSHKKETT